MDVMISQGFRSSAATVSIEPFDRPIVNQSKREPTEVFLSRHGRYEIVLSQEPGGWLVQYISTGRLFGPRVELYRELHKEPRHAAWDVMARVIRATNCEQTGINVGRQAMTWVQQRLPIC